MFVRKIFYLAGRRNGLADFDEIWQAGPSFPGASSAFTRSEVTVFTNTQTNKHAAENIQRSSLRYDVG